MPAAAPPKKSNVLWWVLGGVGAFILICILAVAGFAYYFLHNPGRVIAKIITAANPDVEILNIDNAGRRITVRDKRDGKQVTLSFDDVQQGRFTLSATDENGKTGRLEIGEGAGKLPAWVPVYPGARVESHLSGNASDAESAEEGGMFTLTTSDSPSQVMTFYRQKAEELGMTVNLATATADGGHLTAADADDKRTLNVLVGSGSGGGSSATVTFGRKR